MAKATNVNVTLNSADSFTIKWENPAPEVNTGAEINCVPDSEGSITVYKTVGPNQTAITINDLEDGKLFVVVFQILHNFRYHLHDKLIHENRRFGISPDISEHHDGNPASAGTLLAPCPACITLER